MEKFGYFFSSAPGRTAENSKYFATFKWLTVQRFKLQIILNVKVNNYLKSLIHIWHFLTFSGNNPPKQSFSRPKNKTF